MRNPIWRTSRTRIEVLEQETEQKAWPTKSQAGREPAQSTRARDKPRTQRLETTNGGKISRVVCTREAGPNHRAGKYCGNPDARRTDQGRASAESLQIRHRENKAEMGKLGVQPDRDQQACEEHRARGGIKRREGAGWPARSQGTRRKQSCMMALFYLGARSSGIRFE
jgi:hypothetical protein